MKKLYLVISAAAIIAIMGYAAWRLGKGGSSSDVDQPNQAAHQEASSDEPMIDGQIVILPPTPAPQSDMPGNDSNTADFQIPPDVGTVPVSNQGESPDSTPTIVLPPSMP